MFNECDSLRQFGLKVTAWFLDVALIVWVCFLGEEFELIFLRVVPVSTVVPFSTFNYTPTYEYVHTTNWRRTNHHRKQASCDRVSRVLQQSPDWLDLFWLQVHNIISVFLLVKVF